MTPWQRYQEDLKRDDFQADEAQANAVRELQRLFDDLVVKPEKAPQQGLFSRLFNNSKPQGAIIQGVYFWGGVGRGKTYLVDTFYACLPFEDKMRTHFHRFMHRVHKELEQHKGEANPLKPIAKKLADEARVICFDEFFVSDITDAMILGTLFEELFKLNIVLVATSNIVPDDLYRNGLQRARFLPAIELINRHNRVVNVDSGIDYRLRTLEQAEIYHFPLDEASQINLEKYFSQLAPEEGNRNTSIQIEGRTLNILREADGVVMFHYAELCEGPRSQLDYMEISRCYHTVLLNSVRQMGSDVDDAARRFIAMVDEFYERNVKLIMAADVPMTELYTEGRLSFEFKRCLSRLQEMQSHDYLAKEHLP